MITDVDVAIVGGGAAGLATGIFLGAQTPGARIVVLDGAKSPGAKILVSGGSRCNVTNTVVTEADFNGGSRAAIRRVLRAFPADMAAAFFNGLGVVLHEEPGGKLFPDSGKSRDVLQALLGELSRLGVTLRTSTRAHDVAREADRFLITTNSGPLTARFVVLATGGLSLPKTGSDGAGYAIARRLGHTIVPTTPALAPLQLGDSPHPALSGVSQNVRLLLHTSGKVTHRIDGSMLWTHFGVSGPAALDMSRHWLRERLTGTPVALSANLVFPWTFDSLEADLIARSRRHARATLHSSLPAQVPSSVASAVIDGLSLDGRQTLTTLTRDDRRRLVRSLTDWPLAVTDSRGYNYSEVTAGGIDLAEVDPVSMESRRCAGLFAVGEVLDVDGRLGGFNFQWAWSSAYVAGAALATRIRADEGA